MCLPCPDEQLSLCRSYDPPAAVHPDSSPADCSLPVMIPAAHAAATTAAHGGANHHADAPANIPPGKEHPPVPVAAALAHLLHRSRCAGPSAPQPVGHSKLCLPG
jgi:hypothetical protein